jgi:hypothetical protein
MLEVIVGHISWAMMLFRPALSILNYVYSFGRDDPHALIKIPFEVRKELFQIRSILPLLRADVRSAWHPLVHASDASSTGFGVCSRWASPAYVGNLGRQSDRWRFRTLDRVNIRRAALGLDNELNDPEIPLDSFKSLGHDPVLDVPKFFLGPNDWPVCHAQRFKSHDHITRPEGRLLSKKHPVFWRPLSFPC